MRRYQVIILRLRTSPCQLRARLYKIGQVDPPTCGGPTHCRSKETVYLFLFFCTRFEAEIQCTIQAERNHKIRFNLQNLLTVQRILNEAMGFVLASGHQISF